MPLVIRGLATQGFWNCAKVNGILLVIVGCLLILSGCSKSLRQDITGNVTVDGQPLSEGYIKFIPQAGTSGPTAGARIQEGKFFIDREGGTFAGIFRVEITAVRPSNKKAFDHESGQMVNVSEQYIPDKYNDSSELTAEVKASQTNQFEFVLVLM